MHIPPPLNAPPPTSPPEDGRSLRRAPFAAPPLAPFAAPLAPFALPPAPLPPCFLAAPPFRWAARPRTARAPEPCATPSCCRLRGASALPHKLGAAAPMPP